MNSLPLEKEVVLVRLNGIQGEVAELKKLSSLPLDEFGSGNAFKLAQYHLHRALEGVFNITSHILSRFPGGNQGGTYKEMARLLGEKGIVPLSFAKDDLTSMAGYRNRLVHFYADITAPELHQILKNDLGDIEIFMKAVKDLLANPEKFGLTLE